MLQLHNMPMPPLQLRNFHAITEMNEAHAKIAFKWRLNRLDSNQFLFFSPLIEIDLMHGQTKLETC
jgi:hypothetical protein